MLTCLLAETWDNPVCGNKEGVDQDTSSRVTDKHTYCCLAPKQALSPAEVRCKSWGTICTAGLPSAYVCTNLLITFKINFYFIFFQHIWWFFSWRTMVLWVSTFPLSEKKCIPLATKFSESQALMRWGLTVTLLKQTRHLNRYLFKGYTSEKYKTTMKYHFIHLFNTLKHIITSAGDDVKKLDLSYNAGANVFFIMSQKWNPKNYQLMKVSSYTV